MPLELAHGTNWPPSLSSLAALLQIDFKGDHELIIAELASLTSATAKHLTFFEQRVGLRALQTTKAGAVLVTEEYAEAAPCDVLICPQPRLAFARLTQLYDRRPPLKPGISATATVAEDAEVDDTAFVDVGAIIESGAVIEAGVSIGPYCVIGAGVRVGAGSKLYAHVVLYYGVNIGSNCILHAGTVIGADGFGFAPSDEGYVKFHQLGSVRIGDDCELGAVVTIDRGALDDTVIGRGVKMDDNVHIGHNVYIGDDTALSALCGIGGGVRIGRRCGIGGGSIILGQLQLADDVFLEANSMIGRSVRTEGARLSSNWPAEDAKSWRKWQMRMRRPPAKQAAGQEESK